MVFCRTGQRRPEHRIDQYGSKVATKSLGEVASARPPCRPRARHPTAALSRAVATPADVQQRVKSACPPAAGRSRDRARRVARTHERTAAPTRAPTPGRRAATAAPAGPRPRHLAEVVDRTCHVLLSALEWSYALPPHRRSLQTGCPKSCLMPSNVADSSHPIGNIHRAAISLLNYTRSTLLRDQTLIRTSARPCAVHRPMRRRPSDSRERASITERHRDLRASSTFPTSWSCRPAACEEVVIDTFVEVSRPGRVWP